MNIKYCVTLSSLILILLVGCGPTPKASETADSLPISPQTPTVPVHRQVPCPVKLLRPRMVHNSEMDVYITVQNISAKDIAAISFGAVHTDKFGVTWAPYKTDLTSEDTIRHGRLQSMHWEILMGEHTDIKNAKPGSSQLYVNKVAFSDGQQLGILDIDGCEAIF